MKGLDFDNDELRNLPRRDADTRRANDSALRTKPARRIMGFVSIIVIALSLGVLVFFLNLLKRSLLEDGLPDDKRFRSRFQPYTRVYPSPETDDTSDIGHQSQNPKYRLLEAKFLRDRVCINYLFEGQRELVFGPGLRIWIGTREAYRGGVTIWGEKYAQIFTGLPIHATFKDASGQVELELDFPGTAEFIALCRHQGAEVNLSLSIDERIASSLAAAPSWQPGWEPSDDDQESQKEPSVSKPKLWNPRVAAIWAFLFCASLGAWLHAANWRELGKPEKARRSMAWFYGYIFFMAAYAFILPYFLLTPDFLDYTYAIVVSTIWYFFDGKEQVRYIRESQLSYERKGWLKPILTACAIISLWVGLGYASDELFQASQRADAHRGDVSAQIGLGARYFIGKGVSEDKVEAMKWLRKAADQGDVRAQFYVGVCYAEGEGVPKDEVVAAKWLRKAADQGHAEAQFLLGVCYAVGAGLPKDLEAAVAWYRKSAEQDYLDAQFKLATCYTLGSGVPADLALAVSWLRKAADRGHVRSKYLLGFCYANGEGVPKDLEAAVSWYRKAAEEGYAEALYSLGACYHKGEGVPKDEVEAYAYWNQGANEKADKDLAELEKQMTADQIASGKKRTKELKRELDDKMSAKNTGK